MRKNSPLLCKDLESFYIDSSLPLNGSNSFRLTNLFVPTKSTNGQLGVLSILSILLMPILLYFAASLVVRVIFRRIGTMGTARLAPLLHGI